MPPDIFNLGNAWGVRIEPNWCGPLVYSNQMNRSRLGIKRKVSFSTVEYYESCSSLAVWHWGLIPRHCFGAMEMYCTTTQQINGGARLMVGLHKAAPCRTCYLFPRPWSCCFSYILQEESFWILKGYDVTMSMSYWNGSLPELCEWS